MGACGIVGPANGDAKRGRTRREQTEPTCFLEHQDEPTSRHSEGSKSGLRRDDSKDSKAESGASQAASVKPPRRPCWFP